MVLTSPAALLKEGVEAGVDKWSRQSGRLHSILPAKPHFGSCLNQDFSSSLDGNPTSPGHLLFGVMFLCWNFYIAGCWKMARVCEEGVYVASLWKDGIILDWRSNPTFLVLLLIFPSTNPSHSFKATKTVVINASVELTLDECSQSCSSDLHSVPLVKWTFRVLPGSPTHAGVWNKLRAVFRRVNCHQEMWHAIFPPDGLSQPHGIENYSSSPFFAPPSLIPLWIHCPRLILFASAACEWSV